jgi:16S rRNA (guanine(966)-N(2))-methyltransferase RsmD
VFRRLEALVEGCQWLDVCCGVGTMGAEALARGARGVTGIDRSPSAAALTRDNWQKIKRPNQEATVIRADAHAALRRLRRTGRLFDIVYVDPPYDSPLYETVVPLTVSVLATDGVLIVEHDRRRSLHIKDALLQRTDSAVHGDTQLTFYRRVEVRR